MNHNSRYDEGDDGNACHYIELLIRREKQGGYESSQARDESTSFDETVFDDAARDTRTYSEAQGNDARYAAEYIFMGDNQL